VLVESGKNPSTNRNRGAARADTPFIAFTNAHTVLREDWAEQAEQFFQRHPQVDIVGGPQLNYAGDPYFARLSGDALSSPFCTGGMSRRYQASELDLDADESSLTSANLVCQRRVFERVQFDETLYPGEDPKFVTDAKQAGFKLAYSPELIVFNRRRATLRTLARQIANYGAARVQKETPGELLRHPEFFVPSGLLLYVLLLPLLLLWHSGWLVPLGLYGVLAVFFAVRSAARWRRWEYALALPPLFLWIHLAYGAGFLRQVLRGGWRR
jgi:GT2 family glycosyltransferase